MRHAFESVILRSMALLICAHGLLWGQDKSSPTPARNQAVPFVGCESDGQGGPVKAPSGRGETTTIAANATQRLAYYKAEAGPGVLAPAGWHCFATYGSNGATLYVSPDSIETAKLFSTNWKGFVGPVIQISYIAGETSGRFTVAKTIARVFPAHKAFVKRVIAEGIEPSGSFPYGPYPADTLTYRSESVVEFSTPAQSEGLGTASRLLKNDSPISGVAILVGEVPNLIQLSMRLPLEAGEVARLIIEETERQARLGN